ncbi:P-loop containing nucleoside triphosphate hydrolase protein, partial [Coprinopsis sp. MPI-PUGE-AT-0042]
MISCSDLKAIGTRLQEVCNRPDLPFGGMNVIFAGDFAQLAPAGGAALYSSSVSLYQIARQSVEDENNTLGKQLWHQVTTVVNLTENMRQTDASKDDIEFRDALNNMRYRSCTPDNINFLKTRMPQFNASLRLSDPPFRHAAIITGWNSYRDQINLMSAPLFARDRGEPLHSFYSWDKARQAVSKDSRQNRSKKRKKKVLKALTKRVQPTLWEQPPSTSQHAPGVLHLCVGMPVMIKNNEATELNMTNGQEAEVVGWESKLHPVYPDKDMLAVLFVRLTSAKYSVKIPNLPLNVVPISPISTSLMAELPSDHVVPVSRNQVPVLLNFSMTDFASQGKTREVNVVDLTKCRTQQSIYTALSRGSTVGKTLLLGDLNEEAITEG